jgi:hypothetical protein
MSKYRSEATAFASLFVIPEGNASVFLYLPATHLNPYI